MAKKKRYLLNSVGDQNPSVSDNIIKGVSICSCGPALGHDILIDEICLEQIAKCGNAAPKGIKVGMGHEARITELVGYIQNFRLENGRVLGDLHLLNTSEHAEYVKELATTMPNEIGLSVAMEGEDEEKDGVVFARCSKLSSVDLVKDPAANPNGLYENQQQVDSPNKINDMTPEEFSKLFAESIAPLKSQLDELKDNFSKKFGEDAPTGSDTENLEATGTGSALEATGTGTDLEDGTGATGTDLQAVISGLRHLLNAGNIKVSANPQTGTGKKSEVVKTFEDHILEFRKAGKGLWDATKLAKNEFPKAYENYLERSAKDSEGRQHALALGITHTSLVNQKAFAVKL